MIMVIPFMIILPDNGPQLADGITSLLYPLYFHFISAALSGKSSFSPFQ